MSLSSLLSPATVEMHQPCCDALLGMVQAKVADPEITGAEPSYWEIAGLPETESDAQERDQGQQLMAAELGTEGTQKISCGGTLGSSTRL